MTRWLAAAQGSGPLDNTDKTDKTPDPAVKSVLSVKSETPKAESAAPDADGVARTPEAIEAVWSEATRRAVEIRKTQKPPTCAHCGKSEWTVSVTEPTCRKLHVQCWKAEAREAERQRNGE